MSTVMRSQWQALGRKPAAAGMRQLSTVTASESMSTAGAHARRSASSLSQAPKPTSVTSGTSAGQSPRGVKLARRTDTLQHRASDCAIPS